MLDVTDPTHDDFAITDDSGVDTSDLITNDATPVLTFTFSEAVFFDDANIIIKDDDVVLGTHGQKGVQLLLGATANSVLHGSSCDVLAVRVFDEI